MLEDWFSAAFPGIFGFDTVNEAHVYFLFLYNNCYICDFGPPGNSYKTKNQNVVGLGNLSIDVFLKIPNKTIVKY